MNNIKKMLGKKYACMDFYCILVKKIVYFDKKFPTWNVCLLASHHD